MRSKATCRRAVVAAVLSAMLPVAAQTQPRQPAIPPGGPTPVFNEIRILLAAAPARPGAEAARCEDVQGFCEAVVMRNVIDSATGTVIPTLFVRGQPVVSPTTGRKSQSLSLEKDSGIAESRLFGGELTVSVRSSGLEAARGLPALARQTLRPLANTPIPRRLSRGRIESLSRESDFPARVSIPVYYTFTSGGRDGRLATAADNMSVVAAEPHIMEAEVMSVPPDPQTCVKSDKWNLVEASALTRIWIRVDCFRFLGIADYEHKERPTYQPR